MRRIEKTRIHFNSTDDCERCIRVLYDTIIILCKTEQQRAYFCL